MPRRAVMAGRSCRRARGVVALEYILVVALVALALVGALAYLRGRVRTAVGLIAGHATRSAMLSTYTDSTSPSQ